MRKWGAELIGTFILVFGGCGSAVFAAAFPHVGIGLLGVSLAFGLTVLGCVYAFGHVSGCHLNPAVSFGLAAAGRFAWRDVPGYVAAQLVGSVLAAGVLVFLAKGQPGGYDPATAGLAANGFGDHSPGLYGVGAAFVAEVVLTFIFLTVIIGATTARAPAGFAGIAIGLTLTLVHLVGIPITNLSVNPARSTGPALFVGGWAIGQLWLFWIAPIIGGVLAGGVARWIQTEEREKTVVEPGRRWVPDFKRGPMPVE
jgi:aquaporin Z